MKQAKRRIHKFNFERDTMSDGSQVHVALVDNAANMTEVVSMKSADKVISYEVSEPTIDDNLPAQEIPNSSADMEDAMSSPLPDLQEDSLLNNDNQGFDMENIEKVEVEIEKEKDTTELDALKAQLAELEILKAAKAELDMLKAQVQARKIEEYTDLVKGFSAFECDTEIENVVKGLLSMEPEIASVFIAGFEKQANTIKSFAVVEHGTDLTDQTEECRATLDTQVNDILKSRRNRK